MSVMFFKLLPHVLCIYLIMPCLNIFINSFIFFQIFLLLKYLKHSSFQIQNVYLSADPQEKTDL